MYRLVVFFCLVVSCSFNFVIAQTKTLAFTNNETNTKYFIIKDVNGKYGVVDSNDKVIIPVKFSWCDSYFDNYNAFYKVQKESFGTIELYTADGQKFLDSSRGYDDIFSFSNSIQGYKVCKNGKFGLLDVNFNEFLAPKYEQVKGIYAPLLGAGSTLIFTSDKDVFTRTAKYHTNGLIMKAGKAYNCSYEGDAIVVKSVYSYNPFAEINSNRSKKPNLREDELTPSISEIYFYTLRNKPNTNNSLLNGLCWSFSIDKSKESTVNSLMNFGLNLDDAKVEQKGKVITIRESNSGDYLKIDISNMTYIEFNLSGKIYQFAPMPGESNIYDANWLPLFLSLFEK